MLSKEVQNIQCEDKRNNIRKCNGTKSCHQGDKKIKKKKADAKCNKGSGDLREWHHPANIPCEKEFKKKLRLGSEGNHQPQKVNENVFEQEGHCVNLWKCYLKFVRDFIIFGMPEPWNTCQEKLPTGSRTSPRERSMLPSTNLKGVGDLKSVLKSEWSCRIWSLLARFQFSFGLELPHYAPLPPF